MSEVDHGQRIGRVEAEVQSLHANVNALGLDVTGIKADVKGLGSILNRIERGIETAQERSAEREEHSKPNVTAVISILITMITIIVGGAWLISGSLSRQDERSDWVKGRLELIEQRQWTHITGRAVAEGQPMRQSVPIEGGGQ